MKNLINFICLLYHEARNVRHPIRANVLQRESKYWKIISLPTNKYQAWRHMAKLREKASKAQTPKEIADIFQKEFGLSLGELLELYQSPIWRHSLCGGNKWAVICSEIINLLNAFESGNDKRSVRLLDEIPYMKHNTNGVGEKLKDLEENAP